LFAIDERLDIVEAFVNDSSIRTFITQDFLGRVPDFERLVRKFIRKKANLEVKDNEYSSQSLLLSIRIVIKSMLLLIKCRN
jgi:DNA mismatch repair protein MSH2